MNPFNYKPYTPFGLPKKVLEQTLNEALPPLNTWLETKAATRDQRIFTKLVIHALLKHLWQAFRQVEGLLFRAFEGPP